MRIPFSLLMDHRWSKQVATSIVYIICKVECAIVVVVPVLQVSFSTRVPFAQELAEGVKKDCSCVQVGNS